MTAEQAGRVDLVVATLTGLSRRQVRGLIDHDTVRINGSLVTDTFARAQAGDKVTVDYDPHHRYAEKPRPWSDPTFRIVFEDDHLLVVDKAAAALTVPTGKTGPGVTLIERLGEYMTARGGKRKRAYVCHRLDRGVSGLLVVAKTEQVSQQIRTQFEARKPHRRYVAIVKGHMTEPQGTFRSYLATGDDLSRYSTPDPEKGELAITHYKVERQVEDGATLISVELETGRRNQIRVHLAEAKHPVLGDPRYMSRLARHPRWRVSRLALHATELGFMHPVTSEALKFTSPMPAPFTRFLDGLPVGKPSRKSGPPPRRRKR